MHSWATVAQVALLSSSTALAFQRSFCHNAQFEPLSCLEGVDEALEACDSLLPAETTTYQTVTAPAREGCPPVTTVARTNIESSTTTVTTGPLSTVTMGITQMNSFSVTLTTYVSADAAQSSEAPVSSAPASQPTVTSMPSIYSQPSRVPDDTSLSPQLSSIAESVLSSNAAQTFYNVLPFSDAGKPSFYSAPSLYGRGVAYGEASSAASTSDCNTMSALASLGALFADDLNTACACIGVTAFPTRSITVTETQSAKAQPAMEEALGAYGTLQAPNAYTTEAACEARTSTKFYKQSMLYTKTVTLPAKTITLNTKASQTSTSVVTLAAPHYTQVFGPKAGCADVAANFTAEQLPNTITDETEAMQKCQGMCTQKGECEHVFVQQMLTDYGDAKSYWECFFNDHTLVESTDLDCGQREGTYGKALGWDALGRGKVGK